MEGGGGWTHFMCYIHFTSRKLWLSEKPLSSFLQARNARIHIIFLRYIFKTSLFLFIKLSSFSKVWDFHINHPPTPPQKSFYMYKVSAHVPFPLHLQLCICMPHPTYFRGLHIFQVGFQGHVLVNLLYMNISWLCRFRGKGCPTNLTPVTCIFPHLLLRTLKFSFSLAEKVGVPSDLWNKTSR
jgi:hypothetical protein